MSRAKVRSLKKCPECNGQGFVAKWDTRYRPTILSKCECVRCGGVGVVRDRFIRKGET